MNPEAFLVLWIVCAIVGWAIGNRKGHPWAGLVLGLLLTVFGVIFISLVPVSEEKRIRNVQQEQRIENEARRRSGQDPPVR